MASLPSPLDPSAADLSVDPVIGWRMWRLARDGRGRLVLLSPMQAYRWRPMQPSRAGCSVAPFELHRTPAPGCSCGFYAAARPERLPRAAAGLPTRALGVVGSVAMWGRVVEHALGYRAEFAYPDRLRLVCGRCFLSGGDGVPTRIVQAGGEVLIPVCDRHGSDADPDLERLPVAPADVEQELLSTYAVDVLPLETLRAARFVAVGTPSSAGGSAAGMGPPSSGFRVAARSEFRELLHSGAGWLGAVVLVFTFLVLRALGVLATPDAPEPVRVVSVEPPSHLEATLAELEDLVRPGRPSFRHSAPAWKPDRRAHLAAICGRLTGTTVELLPCGRKMADLFGAAWFPPEPRKECDMGTAYTRKERFSVCWLGPVELILDESEALRTWRLPGVHWGDLRQP